MNQEKPMPLRVTIEIVPHGVESAKRKLASIEIINDLTGTPNMGNYLIRAEGEREGEWRKFFKGKIIGVPRGDYLGCTIACLKALEDGKHEQPSEASDTGKKAEAAVRGNGRRRGK
jgi:hypothetical protein